MKDIKSTSTVCNAAVPRSLSLVADVPGGATWIQVELRDMNLKVLKYAYCTRQGCVIYNAPTS